MMVMIKMDIRDDDSNFWELSEWAKSRDWSEEDYKHVVYELEKHGKKWIMCNPLWGSYWIILKEK